MQDTFLLVVDSDVILRSDDGSLRRFSQMVASQPSRIELVYATKLHFQEFRAQLAERPVPPPIAAIAAMGTEVCSYPDGQLDQGWMIRISARWCATTVHHVLTHDVAGLTRLDETPFPFFVSCRLDEGSETTVDEVEAVLAHAGVDARCVQPADGVLHVMPRGVDVGLASAFVARQLGVPQHRVIVAGDSVFDARLFDHGFYGIVLSDDARVTADANLDSLLADEQVYIAQKRQAEGLCEGLRYWLERLGKLSPAS